MDIQMIKIIKNMFVLFYSLPECGQRLLCDCPQLLESAWALCLTRVYSFPLKSIQGSIKFQGISHYSPLAKMAFSLQNNFVFTNLSDMKKNHTY